MTSTDRSNNDSALTERDAGTQGCSTDPAASRVGPQSTGELLPSEHALTRRTALTLAAFSVPAIAVSVAAPATAASANATIEIVAPATAMVGDNINIYVRTTVRSQSGVPLPNEPVVVSVSPTTVGSFPGNGGAYAGTTNASGFVTLSGLTLNNPGTLTFTATNSGHVATAQTVVGVLDLGVVTFDTPIWNPYVGRAFTMTGTVAAGASGRPTQLSVTYPSIVSGPATVPVNQSTGVFSVDAQALVGGNGPVFASATGATTGTTQVYVDDPSGTPRNDIARVFPTSGTLLNNKSTYTFIGQYTHAVGNLPFPSSVAVSYTTPGVSGAATVAVGADGRFQWSVTTGVGTPSSVGGVVVNGSDGAQGNFNFRYSGH